MEDDRYEAVIRSAQQRYPGIAVRDLRQDVIIAIWKNPASLNSVVGFFTTVLRRRALDQIRKRQAADEMPLESVETLAVSLSVESSSPLLGRLRECLQLLAEHDSELVRTVCLEGTTVVDFAKRINRTSQALYKQLSRLRKKLQSCIEQKG